MSERTEQATPYKLQKAKEQGKVSKSTELNTYILLLVMLGLISLLWPSQIKEVQALLSHLLYLASHVHFTTDNISHLHQLILSQLILLWVPVAFAAVLTIILSTIVQTGLVWSTKVLVPDFKRLNLAQGLKKLCSINSLFDAIKTVIKFCSASILLFYLFKNQLPVMIHHALSQARPDPSLPMHFMLRIIFQLLLLLFFLAFLDKGYTRWKFSKEQKMSKQELKDEYKQKEGDPKIKHKIKQLQFQLRQKVKALKEIKTADVIITNPTHLAIALKYERGTMPAPKVLFKAQDEMVSQVRELAKKHNIPIIEDKLFARMLYHSTDLNQYISKELFPIAAKIFSALYQKEKQS